MIKTLCLGIAATLSLMAFQPAHAAVEIGKAAPDFTTTDTNGKEQKLSAYKGKIVVLEWTNPECPFVKKHYELGDMQKAQTEATAKGAIWLRVNSSAKGLEGSSTDEETNKYVTDNKVAATASILDPAGTIGKSYDAKTTPHMFVVDKDGNVAYEGAIDNNDGFKPLEAGAEKNYVTAAVDALVAGKKVETSQTKPYGCGVKY